MDPVLTLNQVLVGLGGGLGLVFPSVLLTNSSTGQYHRENISWIGSLPQLGMVAGSAGGGLLHRGHRATLFIASLSSLTGWLVIGIGWETRAKSIASLCWGRLLAGLGHGIASVSLVGLPSSSYNDIAFYSAIFVACILTDTFQGLWLVVSGCLVQVVLAGGSLLGKAPPPGRPQSPPPAFTTRLTLPLVLLLKELSGLSAIIAYPREALGWLETEGVLVGVVGLCGALCAGCLLLRRPRRPSISLSGAAASLALMALSQGPSFYSLPALASYVFASTVFAALTLASSLHSPRVSVLATHLGSFICLKSYPGLREGLGEAKTFSLYACASVCTALLAILFLPETHDRLQPQTKTEGEEGEVMSPLQGDVNNFEPSTIPDQDD